MRTLVAAILMVAGCGSEPTPTPAPAPMPTPVASAPPPVAAPAPDLTLGEGFEMRGVIRDGRLAIVPIVATGETSAPAMLMLDAGMTSGKVLVREVAGEWEVDTVRVTNHARLPLLVLRGEIITGAMQDRAFAETKVIMAGTTEAVEVRCVEEDRDYGTKHFTTGRAMAELALRRTIAHADQTQVWRVVQAINERLEISEMTRSYRHAAARQVTTTERRDRIVAQLAAHPDAARIVGVAVALDGAVLAIDRFAAPAIFQAARTKLLDSYVASDHGVPEEGRRLTPEAVRMLAALDGASTDVTFEALQPFPDTARP
jgi:hypothetical protein